MRYVGGPDGQLKAQAWNTTMYIMAGLLVIGFICNALVRAVHERHHLKDDDARLAAARGFGRRSMANNQNGTTPLQRAAARIFVGIPLVWGVLETQANVMKLFQIARSAI